MDSTLELGRGLPIVSVLPFVLLLLAIAVLPLIVSHWWDKNLNKGIISFLCALPIAIFLIQKDYHQLVHAGEEYISFIILLASLYIISGGIYIKGTLEGTPITNTFFLAIGAVLANFIGTTGASMLLIRPLIKVNAKRKSQTHIIVFFIFIVSNIGGCLTPLGDPPLFLGYLRGVPFEWTLKLFPQWAFMIATLLFVFSIFDQYKFNKEEIAIHKPLVQTVQPKEPLKISGKRNFIFLIGIMATTLISGSLNLGFGYKEAAMVGLMFFSFLLTPKSYYKLHNFTLHPIIEVAVLFAGIFVTMVPALLILNAKGGELGVSKPWHFFWASGTLSSFLDNAPTYLVFTSLASSIVETNALHLNELVAKGPAFLAAISCGAVFMGTNTYIGNGPNFMVKAIAEKSGVKMPSFFGYMLWSCGILIPLFIIATLIFFA